MRALSLAAVLERLHYKPGWKFSIMRNTESGFMTLVVQAAVENVEAPHEKVQINMTETVHPEMTDDEFINTVCSAICKMEMHEVDEYFKVDGRHYREPHPELWPKGRPSPRFFMLAKQEKETT